MMNENLKLGKIKRSKPKTGKVYYGWKLRDFMLGKKTKVSWFKRFINFLRRLS